MVRLAFVLGDRAPECENSKEPYPFTMAKYRVSALQLVCVKSGVFLFFLFFFQRKLSVFEHLLKADPRLRHVV